VALVRPRLVRVEVRRYQDESEKRLKHDRGEEV